MVHCGQSEGTLCQLCNYHCVSSALLTYIALAQTTNLDFFNTDWYAVLLTKKKIVIANCNLFALMHLQTLRLTNSTDEPRLCRQTNCSIHFGFDETCTCPRSIYKVQITTPKIHRLVKKHNTPYLHLSSIHNWCAVFYCLANIFRFRD